MPCKAQAYIMPAEQIVFLMAANFSKFKTLVITQSRHQINPQDQETGVILKEKLWLKSPRLYRSELISQPEQYGITQGDVEVREPDADMFFRRLLMAKNSKAIMEFLSEIGVEYKYVAFTRFDGIVAYRLGDKNPDSPKLVIEKDTFLPLFLCYWSQADLGQEKVTVQFADYRKLTEGCWYPHEIIYSAGEKIVERYVILDFQVNVPIERPLSNIQKEKPRPPQTLESSQTSSIEKHVAVTIGLF
jgi:hypothetical protein